MNTWPKRVYLWLILINTQYHLYDYSKRNNFIGMKKYLCVFTHFQPGHFLKE